MCWGDSPAERNYVRNNEARGISDQGLVLLRKGKERKGRRRSKEREKEGVSLTWPWKRFAGKPIKYWHLAWLAKKRILL